MKKKLILILSLLIGFITLSILLNSFKENEIVNEKVKESDNGKMTIVTTTLMASSTQAAHTSA